jgi:hypothetical protein
MIARSIAALVLIMAGTSISAAEGDSLAWKRWHHLQRGVALSGWFSESVNYSMQRIGTTESVRTNIL